MQQYIKLYLKKKKDYLKFVKNFFKSNNPINILRKEIKQFLKDIMSINHKRKMIKAKLKYQMSKMSQMEKLIAQNNEHVFLRGNKINETR